MALSRVPGDDELYVGGIFTLRRRSALESFGITHIVSVLRYDFKDFEDWEKYEHCNVEVDDVDDEDLLGEFGRTNKFIGEALKGGGRVLVHCAMGKSRSVTVTMAYLLSTRPSLDVESALALIQEARPIAEPNDGFMRQLELYKLMGCPEDVDSQPRYQRWLYQCDVQLSVATGRAPDHLRFEDEQKQDNQENGQEDNQPEKEFRCRKCRRTLTTSQYLVPHTAKEKRDRYASGPKEQDYSPISSLPDLDGLSITTDADKCTQHFIQPLSWMRNILEKAELSGRLECPNIKCGANVGKYAWQGLQCTCGKWIVPAFALQNAKVDVAVKRAAISNGGPGGVRMPPGMKSGEKGNL